LLASQVQHHQQDWDLYLDYVTFIYNNSVHSVTGEVPGNHHLFQSYYGQAHKTTLYEDIPTYESRDRGSVRPHQISICQSSHESTPTQHKHAPWKEKDNDKRKDCGKEIEKT